MTSFCTVGVHPLGPHIRNANDLSSPGHHWMPSPQTNCAQCQPPDPAYLQLQGDHCLSERIFHRGSSRGRVFFPRAGLLDWFEHAHFPCGTVPVSVLQSEGINVYIPQSSGIIKTPQQWFQEDFIQYFYPRRNLRR